MGTGGGFLATVRQAKNCPLRFRPGERMFFAIPGIEKEESDRICALATVDLIPVIQRIEKAGENQSKALEIGRSNFCTGCKSLNAFVEFEVTRATTAALAEDSGSLEDQGLLETLEALKGFPIFAPLPTRSLARILACVDKRDCGDGEVILRKGERGERLWLLVDGEVDVTSRDANNVETVLATLKRGDVMGEMSLLTGEPVTATLRCRGAARFLTLEKAAFERLLSHSPALNVYFTRLLAERLKTTSKRFISEIEKGVLGYLSMIAPPELIQALETTARSGVLLAREDDSTIEIYLHDGHLHRITPGGKTSADPEEAFYEFLSWRTGTFRFEPGARDEERTFWKETTALLLEGMRRVDEANAPAEASPPGEPG